ncbi:ArsR/SmtB family transcription factor [Marivita hallyeonensis]|uniref:Transcriptional regulator, ArsR family n=1 Tax=Marivita hallyeonensis TaxID=996342 RepID=A0A1M5TW90_9RHOB|nr:metalloregulator ArsR/SmtB family transcription factor [Marivita hallyeonensis]SHH54880.1 transcriptional regulator, ArsR family [Marivita hallyeonensis]
MDKTEDTARALAALGHEARLRIFRVLVKAGHDGLTVGEIAAHLGLPASTQAHHLKMLVDAHLVTQKRQGRAVINTVDFDKMTGVVGFLSEECCQGFVGEAPDTAA